MPSKRSIARRVARSAMLGTALAISCWLRVPIQLPRGRPIRILIYARYSTDEQDKSSITDQVAYCRQFVKAAGIENPEVQIFSDEAESGEHASRPGSNAAKRCIEGREVDLVVVEDSSRLFRNLSAFCTFVGKAYDEGVRVICINDYIDTAEEEWLSKLHEARKHHTQ